MLVLNSVNRLSSTILLTGGITPIVAAGLIGTISWTRWFVLMSVPYLALIALAAAAIYLRYRHGFHAEVQVPPRPEPRPLSGVEWRTALITAGAGLLWLTDSIHHWHPTLPALLAWVCFLMPGVGVLTWRQFEQEVGWANFFVLASSLSLAQALSRSGASAWLAGGVVGAARSVAESPWMVVGVLLVASAVVRLLIPNITGFLATTIPVAMSVGTTAGLNPILCGLIVTDRGRRGPLLSGAGRLVAGGLRARASHRRRDLRLRSPDDRAGRGGRSRGGDAVLGLDRRAARCRPMSRARGELATGRGLRGPWR